MVIGESLTITMVSYALAFVMLNPVGKQMTTILAIQIYALNTGYQLESTGANVWFVVMLVVGIGAGISPAIYAIRITISDTLCYEG